MASGGTHPVKTGSYKADGTATIIDTVGFKPKHIKFVNQTTGAAAEWVDSMPDAMVVTHDTGVDAIDAAQGVTPRTNGFSMGTNAVINTADDVVHYVATGQ